MKPDLKIGQRIECDLSFAARTVADAPDGYIAGVASTPSTDMYGHKILAGAFDRSIRFKGLNGPEGVKLLLGHDWNRPAGIIKRLATNGGGKLEIEAQLSLDATYVRDIYTVTKNIGGLNYSVGFALEEFEFVEDMDDKQRFECGIGEDDDDTFVVIKQADLWEVSVVVFPAQRDAKMTHIKQGPPSTLTEFEKALVADGLVRSRSEAKRIIQAVKGSSHLLLGSKPPGEAQPATPQHPWMDASQLQAATDLVAKAKAILSSR